MNFITYAGLAAIFAAGEAIAPFIFFYIQKLLLKEPEKKIKLQKLSIAKGILERIVLLAGLCMGFVHILTLFGALKIGTRLNNHKNEVVSNDYFLLGNFVSVLLVFIYYWGFSKLEAL
jgi:hypothetical protein